jgi:hypothetical protein
MRVVAVVLVLSLAAGPVLASTSTGARIEEIPGLKRTNQVLSAVLAFLKLVDELNEMPSPGEGSPMPPPIGTGHPGPGPGPLPLLAPELS